VREKRVPARPSYSIFFPRVPADPFLSMFFRPPRFDPCTDSKEVIPRELKEVVSLLSPCFPFAHFLFSLRELISSLPLYATPLNSGVFDASAKLPLEPVCSSSSDPSFERPTIRWLTSVFFLHAFLLRPVRKREGRPKYSPEMKNP